MSQESTGLQAEGQAEWLAAAPAGDDSFSSVLRGVKEFFSWIGCGGEGIGCFLLLLPFSVDHKEQL